MKQKVLTNTETEALFFDMEQEISGWFSKTFSTTKRPPSATKIYGIPRGGIPEAYRMAGLFGFKVTDDITKADLVVDDLIDSGETMNRALTKIENGKAVPFFVLFNKDEEEFSDWLVFPWEADFNTSTVDITTRFLEAIGENSTRDGLKDTPNRVSRSWQELYKGYNMSPEDILKKVFVAEYDEMVILKGIDFYSTCEHHIMPFFGKVSIGYIPGKENKVVRISKLVRLVECFSRRLQIQERMTLQIAEAINTGLNPLGVGILVDAQHLCMITRGVRQQNSVMKTSSMLGVFRDKPEVRAEFLSLIKE